MYNFDITHVSYTDDDEYRDAIRTLFGFVSEDDDSPIEKVLDWVFAQTKHHPLFQTMYIKAASFMISENPETGLTILFAYDYLPLFHSMLLAFHTLGDKFDENHVAYVNLHKKLFS